MTSASEEVPIRARIPADLDTPDQLVAGLTARQVALLASVALPLYGLWQVLSARVPLPVLAALTAPVAAFAVALALGRRDGLSLDQWLLAALKHHLRPARLAPTPARGVPVLPAWAPPDTGAGRRPGVLRLPAEAISDEGVISTGPDTATVLVAASTVTAELHTPTEQAALLGGYARWLNSLSGPVQIVVSARRVDLGARALHVAETAHRLPHPALARAAIAHAEHLLDLSENGDRLTRTVTIACTATGAGATSGSTRAGTAKRGLRSDQERSRTAVAAGCGAEAARRAQRTASALSGLGSRCQVLDGGQVTAVLAAASDPFGPGEANWSRTPPGRTITAAPATALTTARPPSLTGADPAGRVGDNTNPGGVSEPSWLDEQDDVVGPGRWGR